MQAEPKNSQVGPEKGTLVGQEIAAAEERPGLGPARPGHRCQEGVRGHQEVTAAAARRADPRTAPHPVK
jgi:hypothetical protein